MIQTLQNGQILGKDSIPGVKLFQIILGIEIDSLFESYLTLSDQYTGDNARLSTDRQTSFYFETTCVRNCWNTSITQIYTTKLCTPPTVWLKSLKYPLKSLTIITLCLRKRVRWTELICQPLKTFWPINFLIFGSQSVCVCEGKRSLMGRDAEQRVHS